ncbi:UDP-N-acetylglucosamine 4,6-dehydratase [Vagococcus fluvialis bH819]|uniref:UDP-N-acetylglucosamine 4,6-dehydratase n=1 Tax=Vagococcus fluvialis bH819 TaxID=1255619 RepID=A0A1X6WLW1_9ENTE|nr:UDP-N-acetylglucosamine 4,6-dehydratase [Vagococcus fluvialis bH819]
MGRKTKMAVILLVDLAIIVFANLVSNILLASMMTVSRRYMVFTLIAQGTLYILFGFLFGVFNRITRYTSINSLVSIFSAITAASTLELIFFYAIKSRKEDLFQSISAYFIALLLIISSRIVWRVIVEHKFKNKFLDEEEVQNAFIIGAGDAGEFLYNTLRNNTDRTHLAIRGFIDDDVNKYKTILCGLKVLGGMEDLPKLIDKYDVQVLTVAIPSMTAAEYERLLDIVNPLDVELYTIPSIEELATGKVAVTKFREIDVVDLLGRDEVKLEMETIKSQITNQVIMVTGAGGSIGSEICRQIMTFSPKMLLLLGHGENSIYLIEKELNQTFNEKNTEIIPVIGDVRDAKRMFEVMEKYQPNIVYHAAAHKHVPLMEYNPAEALKNNIYGTKNVAEAALASNVGSFVMISQIKR